MAFNPIVDDEKCVGCEECVDVCPVEVFEMTEGKSVPVNAEECLGCESCVEVCEEGAIVVEETQKPSQKKDFGSSSRRGHVLNRRNTPVF